MEFCGCGSVQDLIKILSKNDKKMNEAQIASIVSSVVKGLIYLHDQKVIHRDLKVTMVTK